MGDCMTDEEFEAYKRGRVTQVIENLSCDLILTILYDQTGGSRGKDYRAYFPDWFEEQLFSNKTLCEQLMNTYKDKLLSHDLWEPHSWAGHDPEKPWGTEWETIVVLGLEDEYRAAYEIRKKKYDIQQAEHEARIEQWADEDRIEREEEDRRLEEECQRVNKANRKAKADRESKWDEFEEKVKEVHPILELVKINRKSVVVTIGNGSFVERSVFKEALTAVKDARGRWDSKKKTWSIPL